MESSSCTVRQSNGPSGGHHCQQAQNQVPPVGGSATSGVCVCVCVYVWNHNVQWLHSYIHIAGGPLPARHCWCSGIIQDSHSCDPGSIPGQCTVFPTFLNFLHSSLICSCCSIPRQCTVFPTFLNFLHFSLICSCCRSSSATGNWSNVRL